MKQNNFESGAGEMPADQGPAMMRAGAGGLDESEAMNAPTPDHLVPLQALAMPGEDEHLNNPEVGDRVAYQVEGKVRSIKGDVATVTPETINGKPVTADAAKTADEDPDQEKQQLYDMAKNRDSGGPGPAAGAGAMPGQGGMA